MDIMLERILSLIPKKTDGKFVHGAKKVFCDNVGLSNITILSQWLSGASKSYEQYAYQIANAYNVSVNWLKGETDDPAPKEEKAGSIDVTKLLEEHADKMTSDEIVKSLRILTTALEKK